MEIFHNAKTVRFRGHHDKYLVADDGKESVVQERQGGSKRAGWTVELVNSVERLCIIRLKSCYDKYLTATGEDFLMVITGKKVRQSVPRRVDSSVEWEALRGGMQVKLKTRYGNFLRANGGLPPWPNSITHDFPSRSHTREWILWDDDVLEYYPPKQEPQNDEGTSWGESQFEFFTLSTSTDGRLETGELGTRSSVKDEGRVIQYNVIDDSGNIVEGGH